MKSRWVPRTLLLLTATTALLPFVLHCLLTRNIRDSAQDQQDKNDVVWTRPMGEVQHTAPWTLFYHMYFPPNDLMGYDHASMIVQEQLGMIGKSFATQSQKPVLYYTVIGEEWKNQTWMDDLCHRNNLDCILLNRMKQGQEDITLQLLYNFCKAIPSQSVVYLHTKGSFHASGPKFATQDIWRQRLTEAVTHKLCLEAVTIGEQCETCSLLLQPLPGIHYPGNMWTARCTHVRRLLPPNSFAVRMDRVVQAFKNLRDTRHRLNTTFFPQMPHMMGRKRFAAEHWIGSHPHLRYPCDLSAHVTANLSDWLHPSSSSISHVNFTLGHSPTYPIHYKHWDYFRYGKRGHTVLETPSLRLRDYFLLPGQLLKWYQLYRSSPPRDSWLWKWFPDPDIWQEKIRLGGANFWMDDRDDWLPPGVDLFVRD